MEKNAAADAVDPPLEDSSSSAAAGAEQPEESGWTDYLEDCFTSEIEIREGNSLCSSVGSCSWDHNIPDPNSAGKAIFDVPKKLTFKKTRTQKIFEDNDSLEDTATSPIHSTKVADLKVRTSHVNPRLDDHITMISSSTASGRLPGNYCSNTEKAVYSAADLKKKGLCSFPFSMQLLNYHN